MKSYDIFISYRREDGAEKARTLKSELELQGFHVFLDFDELKDGVFDQRIINAIESAPIFMMILSPHALDRCVNDDDWVRREIECALANRRHFVPVDPDRSFPGFLHELPDSVKQGLGQHQFSEIMFGQLFKESVAKMVRERIRPALDALGDRDNGTPSGAGALIHIESDLDCRIFRFGKEIGLALKGEETLIRLIRGKHKLEFVSFENDADRLAMLYPVPENDYEDILTVELLAVKQQREAAEAERIAREKAETERRKREAAAKKAEEERIAREKAERERIEREKAEAERRQREAAAKKAEAERRKREATAKKAEEERIAREKAERERIELEKAERERVEREKAEAERRQRESAAKKAEEERIAQMVALGKGRNGVYQVGDYYNDGTKQGVVFAVSDGGRHGKIVSLVQSNQQWASENNFGSWLKKDIPAEQRMGMDDEYNGMNNQRKIQQISGWREKYPAFARCADLGEGWYLPAIEELRQFTLNDAVHDAVNRTLEAKGGTKLSDTWENNWYWSSTEDPDHYDDSYAWCVSMYNGYTHYDLKYNDRFVRAVFAF